MTDFTDLTLNNGETAILKGVDYWSRPYYEITVDEDKYTVCCTELNGTFLHYYSPRNDTEGEPDFPIPHGFQPVPS